MISGKTILIAPIDWGLGHATRCVSLIKELSVNNKFIIGVTPLNSSIFDDYFPETLKVQLPSYSIKYSKSFPLWLKLLFQLPKILLTIRNERKALKNLIALHQIDFIISDNRFGLNNKHVHSVFITHQLKIKTPVLSVLTNWINRNYINRFDEVWVPDYSHETMGLSGDLSNAKKIKIPVKYIGPQSALSGPIKETKKGLSTHTLILLSGVEPQRTLLENELLRKFEDTDKQIILVRGSNKTSLSASKNFQVINFASGNRLKELIVNAQTVICRSGYSTLMDLHLFGKNDIILIPTPGQTEQEYLAEYWKKHFNAIVISQKDIQKVKRWSSIKTHSLPALLCTSLCI